MGRPTIQVPKVDRVALCYLAGPNIAMVDGWAHHGDRQGGRVGPLIGTAMVNELAHHGGFQCRRLGPSWRSP